MESSRQAQVKIGIFIALGLFAAVVSVLALGGERTIFRSYVRIKAKMDQVQGLNTGSVVSLTGVTIGNIEAIEFGKEDSELVVVLKIDKQFQNRIFKDASVETRTQGALGDKFLYMTPGTPAAGQIENNDTLEASKATDLMGVISQKGGDAVKIFDIISEMEKLLKAVNADNRPEKIMKNFAETSASLKEVVVEAKQLIGEMRSQNSGTLAASMRKLDSILTKIDRGEGSLGALINDPSLHEQLRSVIGASPRKQYMRSVLQNSIEKK